MYNTPLQITPTQKYVFPPNKLFSYKNVAGVFSTVSRLASIVIRVGFKHVEDSYYLFFAQMLRRGLPPDQQVCMI